MKKYSEEPIEVTKDNIESLKSEYQVKKQKCYFKCEKCGNISTPKYLNIINNFLCKSCLKEKTIIEKYGSIENYNKEYTTKAKNTLFEKYGVTSSNKVPGAIEKTKQTKLEKYGAENFVNTEKAKQTKKEKYGIENYNNSEKTKQTCLDKYGVDNASKTQEVKDKMKQTCLDKYGVNSIFESEEWKKNYFTNYMATQDFREKSKATCLEKYGTENYSESDNFKEKYKQTCLEKYGTNSYFESEEFKLNYFNNYMATQEFREKSKKACLEKYGVEKYFSSDDFRTKIKDILISKYGVDNYAKSKEFKEKYKQTCLDKYGRDSYFESEDFKRFLIDTYGSAHVPSKRYIYDNVLFDSSWELYYWIYCKDNNIDIKRCNMSIEYIYNDKVHYYFPDFELNNELVEIKGNQFFKEDGTMCNPFDHTLDELFEAKHQCMINNNVKILRYKDLEDIIHYVDNKYTEEYVKLFQVNLPFPYVTELPNKSNLSNVIKYFHKSIYSAKKAKALSPLEAWNDKSLVKKSALNRLKYKNRCLPNDVVNGFNIAKIAPKVSVFKPTLAETLIKKYLNKYSTIFDPFSGFSGRMLGAYKCIKNYIGQDINEEHVRESNEIISYLDIKNTKVIVQDILNDINKSFTDTALFTCSPYSNKEQWSDNEVQKSCDEWIDICLEKYKCDKYLFVVDNTEKYKDYIVDTIENKSHFGKNNEYIILI